MCVQGINRLPERVRWHSAYRIGAAVKSRCLPADSAIPAKVPSLVELLNFGIQRGQICPLFLIWHLLGKPFFRSSCLCKRTGISLSSGNSPVKYCPFDWSRECVPDDSLGPQFFWNRGVYFRHTERLCQVGCKC